jgi:hypothetical protein
MQDLSNGFPWITFNNAQAMSQISQCTIQIYQGLLNKKPAMIPHAQLSKAINPEPGRIYDINQQQLLRLSSLKQRWIVVQTQIVSHPVKGFHTRFTPGADR